MAPKTNMNKRSKTARAIYADLRALIRHGYHTELKRTIRECMVAPNWRRVPVNSLLIDAIRRENVECVKVLLQSVKHFQLNVPIRGVGTPLHAAAKLRSADQSYQICKLLVDHGADVGVMGKNRKRTPLSIVCGRDNCPARLVELLLSELSLRARKFDDLPHAVAAEKGNFTALKMILDFEKQSNNVLSDSDARKIALSAAIANPWDRADATVSAVLQAIFAQYGDAVVRSETEKPALLNCLIYIDQLHFAKTLLDGGVNPLAFAPFPTDAIFEDGFATKSDQKVRNAVEAALLKSSDEAFHLVNKYITPERIAAASAELSTRNPLCLALKHANALRFDKMLKLGFEFQSFQTGLTTTRFDKRRFASSRLYTNIIHYKRARLLSFAMLELSGGSAADDFVRIFLDRDCQVNAINGDELPPLTTLAFMIHDKFYGASENDQLWQKLHTVFDCTDGFYTLWQTLSRCRRLQNIFTLLVDKGANPFYKSPTSAVETPELFICASLFSEMPFFFHLMTQVGFSPLRLLLDLKESVDNPEVKKELERHYGRRRVLRARLAAVARLCLMMTTNSGAAIAVCRDLDTLTATKHSVDADRRAFDDVSGDAETVPSLQRMCRAMICDQLLRGRANNEFLHTQMDKLNLPDRLARFLKFSDISGEELARKYAAESVLRVTAAGALRLRDEFGVSVHHYFDRDDNSFSSDDSEEENYCSDDFSSANKQYVYDDVQDCASVGGSDDGDPKDTDSDNGDIVDADGDNVDSGDMDSDNGDLGEETDD